MSPEPTTERLQPSGDEIGSPPGDRSFRPDVQGLRAVAVLLVLAFHARLPLITGGYAGVDVFFVISGFVITGLLLRERDATGGTSLLGFWARRARRILPAATLVIVATVVAVYLVEGSLRGFDVADDGRWASVFLANLHYAQIGNDYLGAQAAPSPLLHFWSLAVEEQFYLAFPLLFALAAAITARRGRRGVAVLLGLVVLLSLAWSIIESSSSPVAAFYSPLTRAWELGIGGVVALAGPWLRRLPPRLAAAATWLGLGAIGLSAVAFTTATAWPGAAALLPVIGAALVIGGGSSASRWGAEVVLGTWVGLELGAISFSLYLWHFPLLAIAEQASPGPLRMTERLGLLALALLLAVATYRLVENPIRHARRLGARPGLSVAMGATLVAASLVACTAMIATHPLGGRDVRPPGPASVGSAALGAAIAEGAEAQRAPTLFVPSLSTLHGSALRDPSIPRRCIRQLDELAAGPLCSLGDASSARTLVLLGDSQAMAWSTSVLRWAGVEGWRVVLIARDGCAPWRSAAVHGDCARFQRWAAAKVSSVHPQVVVVTGAPTPGATARADGLGAARTVEALGAAGRRVVVLGPVPWFEGRFSGLSPAECIASQPDDLRGCNLSVSTLEASFGAFGAALRSGSTAAGAAYLPVRSLFCTAETCPVLASHRVVYHDPWHFSVVWGRYIWPAFGELLAPALERG